MSTNHLDAGADPLTDAELDLLATLDAKRTPWRMGVLLCPETMPGEVCRVGRWVVWCRAETRAPDQADAEAIAAALNALPSLLAEVRRGRGRARAPAPAPDAWAEPDGDDGADVASDDGPRLHIPRDLLTRP